jgi:hypothetical protein
MWRQMNKNECNLQNVCKFVTRMGSKECKMNNECEHLGENLYFSAFGPSSIGSHHSLRVFIHQLSVLKGDGELTLNYL